MDERRHNPRTPSEEVDAVFTDRWSPRAFVDEPLPEWQVRSLFEAARWAPSSSNEQPWLFLYAVSEDDRARFAAALTDSNREWAARAPLLVYVAARRRFVESGRDNHHRRFDAGAAWMSLALQARRLGLYAHGMAGFDRAAAYELLALPEEDYDLIAAVAVGRHGDPAVLSPYNAERELPSGRKPLADVMREGGYAPPPGKEGADHDR